MTAPGTQREQELQRGRQVAARAARLALIERYVIGKRCKIACALHGHERWVPWGQVNLYYVDGTLIASENTQDENYPSDFLMAKLALAINATSGLADLPPLPPTHHVSEASKRYNDELRERNKNRPDFQ